MTMIYFAHEEHGVIEVDAEVSKPGTGSKLTRRTALVPCRSIWCYKTRVQKALNESDGAQASAWFETREEAERALARRLRLVVDRHRKAMNEVTALYNRSVVRAQRLAKKEPFRFVPAGKFIKVSDDAPPRGPFEGKSDHLGFDS